MQPSALICVVSLPNGDMIMPDLEPLTRQLHIDMADMYGGENEKREVEAYYRGVDAARKEVAWVAFGIALLVVFIAWLAG